MRALPVITLTALVACGCHKDSTTQSTKDLRLTITAVSPNPAYPGDTLSIEGTGFELNYADNSLILSQRHLEIAGGSTTVLFARVPFSNQSAPIVVRTKTDSVVGPILLISPACAGLVCIRQKPELAISDSSSAIQDCLSRFVHWTVQSTGDTISLSQQYCYGDDSAIRRRIRFLAPVGPATPTYLDGFVDFAEYGVFSRTDTIRGYIAFKEWTVPGTLSGRVSTFITSLQPSWDFGYWSDFDFYCLVP